jgi:hypothetical protein
MFRALPCSTTIIKLFFILLMPTIVLINLLVSSKNHAPSLLSPNPQTTPESSPSYNERGISYGELKTYENVATQAITASKETVTLIQWLFIAFITAASSAIGYFYKELKETNNKMIEVQGKFTDTNRQLEESLKQLNLLSSNYFDIQQELFDLPHKIIPFAIAAEAADKGKITKEDLIASEQWFQWQKWIFLADIRGFQQLEIYSHTPGGLSIHIQRSIITEIERINQAIKAKRYQTNEEKEMLINLSNLIGLKIAKDQ